MDAFAIADSGHDFRLCSEAVTKDILPKCKCASQRASQPPRSCTGEAMPDPQVVLRRYFETLMISIGVGVLPMTAAFLVDFTIGMVAAFRPRHIKLSCCTNCGILPPSIDADIYDAAQLWVPPIDGIVNWNDMNVRKRKKKKKNVVDHDNPIYEEQDRFETE